jgi:hypothetical protein
MPRHATPHQRFMYFPPDEPLIVTIRVTIIIIGSVIGIALMPFWNDAGLIIGVAWIIGLMLTLADRW